MTIKTSLYSPKEKTKRNKKIFRLLQEGLSYNQIAEKVGTTPQNIGRIVRQHKEKYLEEK